MKQRLRFVLLYVFLFFKDSLNGFYLYYFREYCISTYSNVLLLLLLLLLLANMLLILVLDRAKDRMK